MFGWSEWLVVLALGVIVFNARKLPLLGKAFMDSIAGFRKGLLAEKRPEREVTPIHPPQDKRPPKGPPPKNR